VGGTRAGDGELQVGPSSPWLERHLKPPPRSPCSPYAPAWEILQPRRVRATSTLPRPAARARSAATAESGLGGYLK
jgi:hypothetical protein